MSNNTIPQVVCGVIPPHMLARVAGHRDVETGGNARATLEHMRELAAGSVQTLWAGSDPNQSDRQRVYDAGHRLDLPGRLVLPAEDFDGGDVQVTEAWDGSGATYEFFSRVFGRHSIDGKNMRIDSTVHYGTAFENAMWNGRQMVYGDGDGHVFNRFTASVDVIAHELTHGVTQHTAALGYAGQTGALNEHISDAFGIMVKQYMLGHSANESDWLIGAELFGPAVSGSAVRSLALPGSAHDHPILGADPQPSHMRDYVHTSEDNGGVHINSGILNHAFYLAAMEIGGKTWKVLGKVWYAALTSRLTPQADFADFTRATVAIAGELYGHGGNVQRAIAAAWADVGLADPTHRCFKSHDRGARRRARLAANAAAKRRAQWLRDVAGRRSSTKSKRKEKTFMNDPKNYPNPHDFVEYRKRRQLEGCVRRAHSSIEHENTLVAETPIAIFQRLLKVYKNLRPMLVFLTTFGLMPAYIRSGIGLVVQLLDSLVEASPKLIAYFKAGRDLEEAA